MEKVLGVGALWLDGWTPQLAPAGDGSSWPVALPGGDSLNELTAYVSYFALTFFALRWWRLTDRRRAQRFSFAPVLAAGFWALILLLIWSQMWRGAVVLVMASAVVQLVSPWEQPPPAASRRLRLRYA